MCYVTAASVKVGQCSAMCHITFFSYSDPFLLTTQNPFANLRTNSSVLLPGGLSRSISVLNHNSEPLPAHCKSL